MLVFPYFSESEYYSSNPSADDILNKMTAFTTPGEAKKVRDEARASYRLKLLDYLRHWSSYRETSRARVLAGQGRECNLQVADKVYHLTNASASSKLASRVQGPFQVDAFEASKGTAVLSGSNGSKFRAWVGNLVKVPDNEFVDAEPISPPCPWSLDSLPPITVLPPPPQVLPTWPPLVSNSSAVNATSSPTPGSTQAASRPSLPSSTAASKAVSRSSSGPPVAPKASTASSPVTPPAVPKAVSQSLSRPTVTPKAIIQPSTARPTVTPKAVIQPSTARPTVIPKAVIQPSTARPTVTPKAVIQPSTARPTVIPKAVIQPSTARPTVTPKVITQPLPVRTTSTIDAVPRPPTPPRWPPPLSVSVGPAGPRAPPQTSSTSRPTVTSKDATQPVPAGLTATCKATSRSPTVPRWPPSLPASQGPAVDQQIPWPPVFTKPDYVPTTGVLDTPPSTRSADLPVDEAEVIIPDYLPL